MKAGVCCCLGTSWLERKGDLITLVDMKVLETKFQILKIPEFFFNLRISLKDKKKIVDKHYINLFSITTLKMAFSCFPVKKRFSGGKYIFPHLEPLLLIVNHKFILNNP